MEDKTEAIRALTSASLQNCRQDPALYFAELDSECEIRGISNQKQKYHLAGSMLPHEATVELREIIFLLLKEKPYTRLKSSSLRER